MRGNSGSTVTLRLGWWCSVQEPSEMVPGAVHCGFTAAISIQRVGAVRVFRV